MSSINPVSRSMNGIKTIETSEVIFTDDNSSLNTSAGIVQAQANSTTALNGKINSVDFDTNTGVLTLNKEDGGTLTKDLDGRYLESVGVDDIPNLPASKITEGTLATARIPDLPYVETTGDETIDDVKTFSSVPKTTATPSANTDLITKGYADNHYLQTGTAQSSTSHTIFGAKTFNSVVKSNGTPSADTDLITKEYADAEYVKDTTAQTIAGVKTFSSVPKTTATPTTNTDLTTKSYVDTGVGLILNTIGNLVTNTDPCFKSAVINGQDLILTPIRGTATTITIPSGGGSGGAKAYWWAYDTIYNATSPGTNFTFGTTSVNVGNGYNGTTGYFTCPVGCAGKYYVSFNFKLSPGINGSTTIPKVWIFKTPPVPSVAQVQKGTLWVANPYTINTNLPSYPDNGAMYHTDCIIELDEGDRIHAQNVSTSTIYLWSHYNPLVNNFSGFWLGA